MPAGAHHTPAEAHVLERFIKSVVSSMVKMVECVHFCQHLYLTTIKNYRKFSYISCFNRVTALPSGVLQIYDVGPEDAGNYRCVAATIAHKRKSMEASLTIVAGTSLKWLFVCFLPFL
jgi:hypothetical protein